MVIENAIIESTTLDISDRGCLQGWIMLKMENGNQGFGGSALYLPKSYKYHKVLSTAGHWIFRVCEIAGAPSWERLKGKTIRIAKDDHFGSIKGIGHITDNDWFYPATDFQDINQ